jgi:nucleoside-diphosphate-sugar epimerase
VSIGNIGADTDWTQALVGVSSVVHLAGRAHTLRETCPDPISLFRSVNREGTLRLARMAAEAGVRRFVFVSSIGVNGNQTKNGLYTELDEPKPHDLYAISKYEAEQGLHEISALTGMQFVIVRPTLVYGPDAPGNFRKLLHLVEKGLPLPFGTVNNRRSLLYLGNLVDALALCLTHPSAANQIYLVSDGEDVSTPELIRLLAMQLGKRAHLLPVPPRLLELAGKLVGKSAAVQRLLGSLAVDSGKIRRELGWRPPYSLDEGLRETAKRYLDKRGPVL